MKSSRDFWLAVGLVVAFIIVAVLAAIQQTRDQTDPPLASFSSQPDGAQALAMWLAKLEYDVLDPAMKSFELPFDLDWIFMLEPGGISDSEWEELEGWIDAGGTLLLAGSGAGAFFAAQHFDFNLAYIGGSVDTAVSQAPLFNSPPLTQPTPFRTRAVWQTDRTDFVTHLVVESQPVLVSFDQGNGRVILSTSAYPFSNAGLKEGGNPELILNLLPAESSRA